jgi:hypothetical protein
LDALDGDDVETFALITSGLRDGGAILAMRFPRVKLRACQQMDRTMRNSLADQQGVESLE